MTEPVDDEEEFTELYDADFPRVDLVGKAANGTSFLIAKGQPGLLSAGQVRDLIADQTSAPEVITVTGSPAAIAKMIHNAPTRLPDVSKENDMTAPADVAKADGVDLEAADVIGTGAGGSTAESQPGSPAWEELDAETAENAISVLGRAKAAVDWLISRENQEAVTDDSIDGAADSSMNAYDLGEVCRALECAIGMLGAFMAGEKLEAELGDELAAVGKAFAALDADLTPLTTIERYAPVVKAGRVLSAANEQRIRSATEALEQVLSTLPAPIPDDGQPVAKAEGEPMTAPATETEQPAADVDDVEKAKGDPQMAVFDEEGKLVGTIDPKNLIPIAKPDGGSDGGDAAAEAAPAEAATEADLQPQAAADAGTAAHEHAPTATAPAAAPAAPAADEDQVEKSIDERIEAAVKAAMENAAAENAAVVKSLQDQLDHLAAPAPSKVLVNGQLPPAHQMRGQDRGGNGDVDVAKAAELREQFYASTDAVEQSQLMTAREDIARAAVMKSLAARRG